MPKVPVQKGAINSSPKTSKTTLYPSKVSERAGELRQVREGQTLGYKSPKK
jgi:hypothetical protein